MEELKRWRLILGEDKESEFDFDLNQDEQQKDKLLQQIYHPKSQNQKQISQSKKDIKNWLEGIRTHFPPNIVSIMQRDALERKDMKEMLLEPELLEKIEPNISLVATILQMQDLLPEKTRIVAKDIVRKLVNEIERKLKTQVLKSFSKYNKGISKKGDPQKGKIDWNKTISKNLKNYQSDYQTIIPDNFYISKNKNQLKEIFLIIDTSESMIESAIYSGIIGSVLASLNSIKTHLIFFNDEVMDLTDQYQDPTDLIFSIPIGGGTDIASAVQYCLQKVKQLSSAYMFLISDMDEYGSKSQLLRNISHILQNNGKILGIFGLDLEGKHVVNQDMAKQLVDIGLKCISCSPDRFPDILIEFISER